MTKQLILPAVLRVRYAATEVERYRCSFLVSCRSCSAALYKHPTVPGQRARSSYGLNSLNPALKLKIDINLHFSSGRAATAQEGLQQPVH
jgi:hypothetical protein